MTLVRYLSVAFLTRFLAVLLALTALVLLIEMLDAVRRLLGSHGGLQPILMFTALKLPLALERLFPLAILIGAALTFRGLVQSNELTILRSAGLSPYRLAAALLPVTAVLAITHFVMVDRMAPAAERAFTDWWHTVVAAPPSEDEAKRKVWLHSGNEIISVTRILDDGRQLEGLTRYGRDENGQLTGRIRAAKATFANNAWRLHDVEVIEIRGASPMRRQYAELPWPNGPTAKNLLELTLPTERLSASKARNILTGTWSGGGSTAHYRITLQKSYCAATVPFLMILLASPALVGGRRTGGMARGMAISLLLGLSFMVTNGLFISMGEAGTIPAVLAVWAAPFIFAALGAALLLHSQE